MSVVVPLCIRVIADTNNMILSIRVASLNSQFSLKAIMAAIETRAQNMLINMLEREPINNSSFEYTNKKGTIKAAIPNRTAVKAVFIGEESAKPAAA